MIVTGPEIINSGLAADAVCDQNLFIAGLPQRWDPGAEGLPEGAAELALQAVEWTNLPELNDDQRASVKELGVLVAKSVNSLFVGHNWGSFRTATAIKRQNGKCTASMEGTAGTLARLGLGQYSWGAWSGQEGFGEGGHANGGFVIADTVVEVDGWSGKAYSGRQIDEPVLREACKKALAGSPSVMILGRARDEDKTVDPLSIVQSLEPGALHTVDFRENKSPYYYRKIVAPASIAILMFSAHAAVHGNNQRYPDAADALRDFAPVL